MQMSTEQKRKEYRKIADVAFADGLISEEGWVEFREEIVRGVFDTNPKTFIGVLRCYTGSMDIVIPLLERVLKTTEREYQRTRETFGRLQKALA